MFALPALAALGPLAPAAMLGLGGGAAVALREAPLKVYRAALDQGSACLTLHDSDAAFDTLALYLAQHPGLARTRNVTVNESYDRDAGDTRQAVTIGNGLHMIVEDGRPFWIEREEVSAPGSWKARSYTLKLRTPGRSREPLVHFLARAQAYRDRSDLIAVYVWKAGAYKLVDRRPARPLDSVHVDPELKADLVADLERFCAGRDWYASRALNWRRGYHLHGPPGCGKTSLIQAVSAHVGRSLYLINPSTLADDNELSDAINGAGHQNVVIEDIDAVEITAERAPAPAPVAAQGAQGAPPPAPAKKGLTTSGLLNAVDGIASRDGRALFITANHPERLDEALLRPGRIDRSFRVGEVGADAVLAMCARFHPEADPSTFLAEIAPELPIRPAALQNRLLAWRPPLAA